MGMSMNESGSRAVASAMEHAGAWVTLSQLVGAKLSLEQIVATVRRFSRTEGLFTLARIAADLANAKGGLLGDEARAWTKDLLAQRIGSPNPLENAVSRAVSQLGDRNPIAHGHVVFVLEQLLLTLGADDGRRPGDGELAFLMLALNDYLPAWHEESPDLSTTESVLGSMFFATIFNEYSDDPLRFIVRLASILGGDVAGSPISAADWTEMHKQAFGCSFVDYVEQFLVPVFLLSRTWRAAEPPILAPAQWAKGPQASLYERWFQEASLPPTDSTWRVSEQWPLDLPRAFFRTPFVRLQDHVLALSPWHIRDHATLGTWAKLNEAAKKLLGSKGNQKFMSAFGYLFERWCARIARDASVRGTFKGKVLLPSSPGAEDEIEDIVVVDRERVVLLSVKASLVPETNLKCAESVNDVITWLRRFFLESAESAKTTGYRAGALWLLDRKVQKIRAGVYEKRGIKKNALVLPVVVCFDNVGECGVLYKWLDEECKRLGILSARNQVRPVTILTPEDYESVFALASRGKSLCDLLVEKTRTAERPARMDWFLYHRIDDPRTLRLPSIAAEFESLVDRSIERLRTNGILQDAAEGVPSEVPP
jgi:hypothetical protein